MLVDLSCSNIVLTSESDIQIALVVSQIEINLSSVIENKNLSVPIGKNKINIPICPSPLEHAISVLLGRRHGSGINIHIRINLD